MSKALSEAMPQIEQSLEPVLTGLLTKLGVQDIGAAVERLLKKVQSSLDGALAEIVPPMEGDCSGSILDGFYSIEYADGRPHRTLRIETVDKGDLKGKTIISYLFGPNNTSDYKSFAFVDVERRRVFMWRRFKENSDLLEAAEILLRSPRECGLAWAIRSNHCFRCNRPLTVPASVHRGLGPVCAGVVGSAF